MRYGLLICTLLAGCTVGPDYVRPEVDTPAAYKEWTTANPGDSVPRGKWWETFRDPVLNRLEEQVNISNQNIRAAEAQYRQALANADVARAALYPTLNANVQGARSQYSALVPLSNPTQSISGSTRTIYAMGLNASWEPDLWGGIRRSIEAGTANAEASGKNLESVRLSTRATLAQDYFLMRVSDDDIALLDRITENYGHYLQIVQNQYHAGYASSASVDQAQTQLESARSQAIDLRLARAQYEHAIAALLGKAPAEFSIKPVKMTYRIPDIPVGIPSQLLQRRPDIAESERLVAAANAQIGVAKSAFFPSLSISPTAGYQSTSFASWVTAPMRTWSVGPAIAQTLFNGGLTRAQTDSAIAAYDAAVATYRQTVLSGFQEVEDNLAAQHILAGEAKADQTSADFAKKSLNVAINQYRAGTVSYLNVITAQASALTSEKVEMDLTGRRMTACVTLIKAIGGGWRAD
ncbi:MAG: efflux transporter outer membrane subunit [Burkholderiales bacterium]